MRESGANKGTFLTMPHARRAVALGIVVALATGCGVKTPGILGPETTARAQSINLETPPVQAPAPESPATPRDASPAAVDMTVSKPPVALPEAKVTPGPDRIELGLADVREAAMANNLDIEVQRIGPALARQDTAEAEARFEATGFAHYTHNKLNVPAVAAIRPADKTATDSAEVGINVPLQTGGTATISMPLTHTDFGFAGAPDTYDAAASLSISQPLLRGAGLKVNQAPIVIARLNERQQDARTKLAILNVLANGERTYWNLYAAARSVEIRLQQYERARTQESQAIRLAQEGVVANIEVTRARAGVARRIEDIIRAENFRRQTERELKRVLNRSELPVGSDTALIATSAPDPLGLELDRTKAVETAYANRAELLDLELQMAIDSLSVDVEKNEKLPALAVDYSFKYLGAASRFSHALDQISDSRYSGHAVGLSLEVPLGNAARDARFERAVLQRALTESTVEQQRQFIERQVLDAADQTAETWQRILAAREESLLAATNYQAEQRQFLAGSRTSTDVLQAADFLAEAQLHEVTALSDYEIAKIDLAFVTGTLLGKGTVELRHRAESPREPDSARAQANVALPTQRIANKLETLGVSAPIAADSPDAHPEPIARAAEDAPRPQAVEGVVSDTQMFGPITSTDTLWAIASAHRPQPDISVPAMMAALVRENPNAFIDGDPARMRVGMQLRIPGADEISVSGGADSKSSSP